MGFVEKETLDQIIEDYEEEGYAVYDVDYDRNYIVFEDWKECYMSISAIPLSHGCIISAIRTGDNLRLWLSELGLEVVENEVVTQTRKCSSGKWTVIKEETEVKEQIAVSRKDSVGEMSSAFGQPYYEDIE